MMDGMKKLALSAVGLVLLSLTLTACYTEPVSAMRDTAMERSDSIARSFPGAEVSSGESKYVDCAGSDQQRWIGDFTVETSDVEGGVAVVREDFTTEGFQISESEDPARVDVTDVGYVETENHLLAVQDGERYLLFWDDGADAVTIYALSACGAPQ